MDVPHKWIKDCYHYGISPIKGLKSKYSIDAIFVGGLKKHIPEKYAKGFEIIPVRGGHVIIIQKEER